MRKNVYSPIRYLFYFKVGLGHKNEKGENWFNFIGCLKSLLDAGASEECDLMGLAAYNNWPSVIKLLANHGFDPNLRCGNLLTPMEIAEQEHNLLAKTALLAAGSPMLSDIHRKHLHFIRYARDSNVPEMEDCFLPEEGFVNKPDRSGKYALLEAAGNWAIDSNWYSAISYLLLRVQIQIYKMKMVYQPCIWLSILHVIMKFLIIPKPILFLPNLV